MLSESMNRTMVRESDTSKDDRSNAGLYRPPVLTSEPDEDGWGIVDESDGILILPGDEETVLLATPLIANPPPKSMASSVGTTAANLIPPTNLDQTRLIQNHGDRGVFGPVSSEFDSDVDDDDEEQEETNLPSFDPSVPTDIPSDLESLPDPVDAASNKRSSLWSRNKPTEHVTMVFPSKDSSSKLSSMHGHEDGTCDGKGSVAGDGINSLREELAFAEELFGKPSPNPGKSMSWNTRALMYSAVVVVSILVLGTSLFLYERQAWQASNSRLEERIEKLQLELIAKLEAEKQQEVQRMMEFASLKQEFQQALMERERQAKEQYEAAVAAAAAAATAAATRAAEQDALQSAEYMEDSENHGEHDPELFSNSNYHKYRKLVFDMPSSYKTDDGNSHIENCWVQAEVKLGECAQEARSVFKSKLQTLGRTLWSAQENLVVKVNDFSKRVQTAAKEAAEHVLSEQQQQQLWSNGENQSFWSYGVSNSTKQSGGSNFRTMATTLVSSVAFATLATVVADKATTFLSGLGRDEDA